MPSRLRRLDDRLLRRLRRPPGTPRPPLGRDVAQSVVRVAQLVLVALAVLLLLAVAAVVLPTDEDNALVRAVLAGALQVAGPFATVFDIDSRALRAAANYGLAAGAYLLLSTLLGRFVKR